MRDVIPEHVFEAIQEHLRDGTAHAEQGWEAGSDEEDTLTGDFGASLRTDGWIEEEQDGTSWQWRVAYKKFRGRGKDAIEKTIGADGIFQVEVRPNDAEVVYKGVLFQAKKYRGSSRRQLRGQVSDMEEVAPGGSAVFEFGPQGYNAIPGREVLERPDRITIRERRAGTRLADYLAGQFLPCKSGLRGLYYDAVRGNLIVPVAGREPRVIRVSLHHRITVEVERSL